MKKIYISLISVSFLLCLLVGYLISCPTIDVGINPNVKLAYLSTCKIEVEDENFPGDKDEYFIATGVLLDTGYVITAAHCIDVNDNGSISPNERNPIVTFYGSIASVHTGYTVFCGKKGGFDIAVVQLDNSPQSLISLGEAKFGDELFTIGMTRGEKPNISVGCESSPYNNHARATIAVWVGNSGGGIWNNKQELVGFVTRVGMARNNATVTIPTLDEDGITFIQGRLTTYSPMSNWLSYTNAEEFKTELDTRRLTFFYKAIKSESMFPIYNTYLRMALHVFGILFCVSVFRKYLFG